MVRAQAEDDCGRHVLVARAGQCSKSDDDSFDPEGKFPDLLTAGDFRAAGVEKLDVGLFWPGEMLRAIQEEAFRLDRSLSWVVQKAWVLAKKPSAASGKDPGLPMGGARQRQSIYLPIEIYAELSEIAACEDRSMSFVIQRALSTAWPAIRMLVPES